MSDSEDQTTIASEDDSQNPLSGRAPLIIFITAAVGGLILVCVFAFLIYCQSADSCTVPGGGTTANNPTPTPFVSNGGGGGGAADTQPAVYNVTLSDSNTVSVTLDTPTRLSISGQDFAVQPSLADAAGSWNPQTSSETIAAWLNGSIINYVFAIQDTESVRSLMQSLERDDQLIVSTGSGRELTFDFSDRQILPVTSPDVFRQTSPGITLLLVGLGEQSTDRMVVRGRYAVEQAAQSISVGGSQIEGSSIAELGEVVQLGDLQMAVTLFDNRPQPASGFAYYLVDYQIQNNGQVPFDTRLLDLTLKDSVGNTYALSLDASQIGNQPPLAPSLGVGTLSQATAGYQIPTGMDINSLSWSVTRTDTGDTVEIGTAASADGTAAEAAENVQITIQNASLVADATSVLIQGEIRNLGAQPVSIDSSEVSFEANGSVFFIQSTNPGFPWTVQPSEILQFSLTVQKPINEEIATFTIMNNAFEISNYR